MEKAIIVSNGCAACETLIEALKRKGAMDKYRVIDARTPEGIDVVSKLGITAVPDCIVIAKGQDGEMARRCTSDEMKKIIEDLTDGKG